MRDDFNSAVDNQQRTIAIGVGVGVGVFVLFVAIAMFLFWRHSKKRKQRLNENAKRINEQTQFAGQPNPYHANGHPAYGQQAWAPKAEMDGQGRSGQYQEMNAHTANSPYQSGQVVEAEAKPDAQEMPAGYRQ
ncbi:hypothetical protein ACJQWK_04983 [Exserohilum turcicum]